MAKYLVETLSSFRIRYVVEARDIEHAHDEVAMLPDDFIEFSQKHMGEMIVTSREVDDAEVIRIFREDNDYLTRLTDSDILSRFVNVIEYND